MYRRAGLLALGTGLLTYAHCKDHAHPLKLAPTNAPGPRVAIIGGGVGGASCAYYLRQAFHEKVTIDIYEKHEIGGRTALAAINGNEYESGASIIHEKNRYMSNFAKKFGLEKRQSSERLFGLSDGKEIYFTGSEDQFMMGLKLLWRYGLDLPKALYFVSVMMSKFEKVYSLQDEGFAFTNVQDLMSALSGDFVEMSRTPLRNVLKECTFGDKFVDEIAMAAVHNNYGQNVSEIHGLAGFVALAGIDSNLWAVKGGNRLIPQNLIKESGANLIKTEVKEVKLLDNGQYEVNYDKLKPRYDIVVLAAPQHERNKLKLTGFKREVDLTSPYQRIVTNFIYGKVNTNYFPWTGEQYPTEITITNPRNYFNTLAVNLPVQGSMDPVDYKELNVWKIFAKRPITDEEMKQIFTEVKSRIAVDWLAYPHFRAGERLPSFIVHNNLYYLNAIERAASAMEMSMIGGRNIALLIFNHWNGLVNKIDCQKAIEAGDKNRLFRTFRGSTK